MVEELRKEKVLDFGENKVQEIRDKYANISWPVRWHLIGHLQTNKIKYIVDKVALIHSVDSIKLAQAIDKEAAKHDVKEVPILIQVNFAHEDTKFGLNPEDVFDVDERDFCLRTCKDQRINADCTLLTIQKTIVSISVR